MISLMILCGGIHEGSWLSYGFWLEGFIWSRLVGCPHTVLVNIPSHFGVMGLLCLILKHLVSLHIVSPCCSFTYVIGVCVMGYDGYYSKRLSLGLVSISWLCFYQHYSVFFWGNHEGYAMRVLGATIGQ
jgi:hypothetical protein